MDCTDILKQIILYLNDYDSIMMAIVSKKTNELVKKMLKSEIMVYNENRLYKIVEIYNNLKIDLQIHFSALNNYKKINYVRNNITRLNFTGNFPNINMENLEYLKMDIVQIKNIKFKLKKIKEVYFYNDLGKMYEINNSKLLKNLNNMESLILEPQLLIKLSSDNLKNLKRLNFINGYYVLNEHIENLINLESLKLCKNKTITNDAFKNLTKIKTLVLFETNVTTGVLQYLPNIECWSPNYCRNDDYKYMKNIEKLKILDLSDKSPYPYISDENIKHIRIKHLILDKNSNITKYGLNKSIKKLDLIGNDKIKDNDLKELNLVYLNLQNNDVITNYGLNHCKNLKMLSLFRNDKITNGGLIHMNKLEFLDLGMLPQGSEYIKNPRLRCFYYYKGTKVIYPKSKITDYSLKKLVGLKYLNLENNNTITDEGIKQLVNLEYLNIKNNKKITINGLINLKKLIEINCENSLLSVKDLKILLKNNGNLKIVDTCNDNTLFDIYYTRGKYFDNNNDKDTYDFYKKYWEY
jgi:hypothetical protein